LSELIKRVIVAAIGIPIAILIVYEGNILFTLTILLLSSLALYEFYKIASKKDSFPNYILGFAFNGIVIIFFGFLPDILDLDKLSPFQIACFIVLALTLFVILTLGSEVFRTKRNPMANIAFTIFGNFYISFSFVSFIMLRKLHDLKNISLQSIISIENQSSVLIIFDDEFCMLFILFILFSVWISDSAAYFIGKSFGKHKLAPRVSPKKTWEGALAGFIGGAAGFVLLSILFLDGFALVHSIVIGIIIGTIGQIGDLAESKLKRDAGVKDSSDLIPGHGGVLDRFDSLLLIMPVVALYIFIIGQ
jgi:phosphatidate cytidylyltransferase